MCGCFARRVNKTTVAGGDSKNNFLSIVRRCKISDDGRNGEYEVACQLRVTGSRVQKEIVYKWSVWRRYSEFERLHSKLKKSLGWQLEQIDFPSSHTFVMNKLAAEFLEQRK